MEHTIKMPRLGDTTQEVVIESWDVASGESVSAGEVLMTVETEKVTTGVPSPVSGRLVSQLVAEGDEVPVGAPFAIIES